MGRREEVADAGVRLIARGGVRALTHRAVDAEVKLPAGSTSYYARTRRDLIALVAARITEQLESDLADLTIPASADRVSALQVAESFLEQLAQRQDAQAARFALLFELRHDEELRGPLTAAAPVRDALVSTAEGILHRMGASDPKASATDFVGLIDALLLYRTADAAPLDSTRVLAAYLEGLISSPRPAAAAKQAPPQEPGSDAR